MQNTKMTECVWVSIPIEVLAKANLQEGGVFQIYASQGRVILENVQESEGIICDGDCNTCPMSEVDCDGMCRQCPCNGVCEESEAY